MLYVAAQTYIVRSFSTFHIEITCLIFPFCVKTHDEDESFSDGLDGDDVTSQHPSRSGFVLGIYNLIRHANEPPCAECRQNRPPAPRRK